MGPLYSLLFTPDLQFVMELLVVHLLQLEQGCGEQLYFAIITSNWLMLQATTAYQNPVLMIAPLIFRR